MFYKLVSNFQVLVSPPLYRNRPLWYQRGLPQVAERFSAVLSHEPPPNLILLPSFTSQDLSPDGVHLTPVAGLHYVLFVFDQTELALRTSALGSEQQLSTVKESVRLQNDRLAYIENRQGSHERRANTKTAADAEFDDWMLNRSEEDWLVVQGLPRISCPQREWQDAARKQVADVIKLVLHVNRIQANFEVYYVSNPFRFQTNRQNLYNVQMDSVRSSKRIRDVFSGFFRGRKPDAIPPPLKGVSIRNKVTPNTKIRISILHQLGSIFRDSNPGGNYQVKGFDPRPVLTTIPPQNSSGRQRTYTFIQAVTLLPATFSDEHLVRIYQVVSEQQPGNLQPLFVVLNDDDRDRCLELVKQRRASNQAAPILVQPSGSGTISGSFSGPGAGMEVQGRNSVFLESFRYPPPPPSVHDLPQSDQTDCREAEKSSGRRSVSPDPKTVSHDKVKDKSKVKDKDRGRDKDKRREKNKSRSRKNRKRRHSSSSSDDRSKKRSKKSKRHRRSPSSSSSSSSSSSAASGSSASTSGPETRSKETEDRTRDRSESRARSHRSRSRER